MKFADVPTTINYNDLVSHKTNSLSPTDYLDIQVKSNFQYLEKLIDTPIYGKEVGGSNYMQSSKFKFIRTKCLQETSVLLDLNEAIGINPKSFRNFNLQKDDILLVKDSNIGEVCYIHKDLPNYSISGGVVKLNINDTLDKFYVIGIMKSAFFKEQIDLMTPKGATIRHSKDNFKYTKIPIPNDATIIDKISILTQSLIKKEVELQNKFSQINLLIEEELKNNQLSNTFNYQMPSYSNLIVLNRFDTGLYTKEFKEIEFLVENYKNGSKTIVEQGFYSIRGQNLQISQIGKSLYSNMLKKGFYKLFLPTHISLFGTIEKTLFIGNSKSLLTVKNDDIIFGAEGFGKGRSFMPLNEKGEYITNIHGTMLRLDSAEVYHKIFIKCMLDWFREKKIIDAYAVGGNGGSFSTMYWDRLQFPLFSKDKQKEIAALYYNPSDTYLEHIINLDTQTFDDTDFEVNKMSGILDLDEQIKTIKSIINNEIKNIVK